MSVRASRARLALAIGVCCALPDTAGCRVLVELVESDGDNGGVDGGGPDAAVDCDSWELVPEHFDPCAIPAGGQSLNLGPGLWTYDTNSGALTDPEFDATFPASVLLAQEDGPEIRVVSLLSLEIQKGAVLRATGKRPLVIAASSTLVVDGTIDVSSGLFEAGSGSSPPDCPDPSAQTGDSSAEGAGGGGGGGFGTAGGDGGKGNDGATAAGTGGAATNLPGFLRGGCPGGPGGNTLPGPPGNGGGALHLAARQSIAISGVLRAGGSGGGGSGGDRSGGSGGGSGGLLDLQAPTITLEASAILASNGGGGGGGADGGVALQGGDAIADAVAAGGGGGQGMGAPGGAGAFAATDAEPGQMARRGGGGGGGGVGFIVIHTPSLDDRGALSTPAFMEP